MLYPIAIEPGDEQHAFGVTVPDIPGCFSAGNTLDEALSNAREAIDLHLSGLEEDGEDIPAASTVQSHAGNPEYAGTSGPWSRWIRPFEGHGYRVVTIPAMPLLYQPKPRSVVMCDFHGFVEPEMVKTRPVVVLASNKRNSKLVTVVPLSTTEPTILEAHHHELSVNPLPDKPNYVSCWAKCDMVVTVSLHRLDRYKTGKREYIVPTVGNADFEAIRQGVMAALGLSTGANPADHPAD